MKIKGAFPVRWAAQNGADGTGVTVASQQVKYTSSTQGVNHPTTGWQTSIPEVADGNFLWTWLHLVFSDGKYTDIYSSTRQGIDGRGIQSSSVTYSQQATSVNPETITDWGDFPSELADGYWLYTRTVITYSDGAPSTSYSVSQIGTGSYYAGTAEYYAAGVSPNTPPDGYAAMGTYVSGQTIHTTWKQERPPLTAETPYLWNFEISSDSRGNRYVTDVICIGNFAKGIVSIVETYAISAQGNIPQGRDYPSDIEEKDWTDEHFAAPPTNEKPYQWNKTVTTYNDGTTDTIYHVSAVKGIDGKGTVYIDLDNENDSILYDGQGNRLGDSVKSNIRLYENGSDITSGKTFSIQSKSPSVIASISGNVLTVHGVYANDGSVIVCCVYNSVSYYARFTVKRLVGVDKYEIVCTPSAISLNTDTGTARNTTVTVEVYRTAQNGTRTHLQTLPTGYTVNKKCTDDSSSTTMDYVDGKATFTPYDDLYDRYRVELADANGVVLDYETIPICRVKDGEKGDSAFMLDADNENVGFIVEDTGIYSIAQTREIGISAYYGANPASGVTYGVSVEGNSDGSGHDYLSVGSVTNGKLTIGLKDPIAWNKDTVVKITVTATHTTYGTRSIVINCVPVFGGAKADYFDLLPSLSAITFTKTSDGKSLTPSSRTLTVQCLHITSTGQTPVSIPSGYSVRYSYTSQPTTTRSGTSFPSAGLQIDSSTSNTIVYLSLFNGTTLIDKESVPIIKGGIDGKAQAYVMLENEMDSLLYDDANTLISGSVSTVARFFYNGDDISNQFTVNSSSAKGCYIESSQSLDGSCALARINDKITVTVNGINDSTGYVNINFVYNDVTYTKKFTVKRIVGGAKYQLSCTPNIINYNKTSKTQSSDTIQINVRKIGSQGGYTNLSSLSGTDLYIQIKSLSVYKGHLPWNYSIGLGVTEDTSPYEITLLQGAVGSGVVIDAQEIPIAITANGENGAQGNGIKSETHYCMFTMTFDQPAANDSGWVQLTDDNKSTFDSNKVTKRNRYLWLKKVYEYDNGDIRALVSLLSQYVDGVEANLLRETAFASEGDMDAWTPANGYIAYEAFGHNNAFVRVMDSDYNEEEKGIDTILQQYVLGEDSNVILKKDTWYTLSFYAQNDAFFRLDEDSTLTGTFTYTMPLKAGKLVTIRYNIENNTIYRLVLMYKADNYEGSYHTVPLDGNIAISFTPNYTDSYTLYIGLIDSSNNWISVTSNQPHIQSLDIDRGKGIDVHIPFLNGSEPLYHNGNVNGTFFTWDLTTEWQHCYVTFKSNARSIYSADAYIKFLLSKSSNTTYICMPKLEENTAATAWIENHLDRVTEQASHILAGDWKENTTYYYLQGVRQVVRYYSDSTKTETRFYRLRKKTSPTGYKSSTPPYKDTEHWEEAKHMPFFSSDFVISEEIMAKIMQVVQLKADEIITRSLVAMRDYNKTSDGTTIQQKIASINEPQYPDGAIVQYWQATSDSEAYNPRKKMIISDGVIEYYKQDGTLAWRLDGSGTIEKPEHPLNKDTVYLVFVCSGGVDTPSDTSSIRTSSILKGTEYQKDILSNKYTDTSGNGLNGWYTLPGAPFIPKPNDKGFMPAFMYYRQVFKLVDGLQKKETEVYFNTSEPVIIE